MKRLLFFVAYFVLGGLLLWLTYVLAGFSFLPLHDDTKVSWQNAGLQTGYLVCGVVWGSAGWDTLKSVSNNSTWSYFWYLFISTLAPIAIIPPFFTIVLDSFFGGTFMSKYAVFTSAHGWLAIIGLSMCLLQSIYKHSEWAWIYRTWKA